jgi:hypothetical protein
MKLAPKDRPTHRNFLNSSFFLIALFPLLNYGISPLFLGCFMIASLFINGTKPNTLWCFSLFYVYILLLSFCYSGFNESMDRLSRSFLLLAFPLTMSSIKLNTNELQLFFKTYVGIIVFKSTICIILIILDKDFIYGSEIPILGTEIHGTFFSYEILIAVLITQHLITFKHKTFLIVFLTLVIVLFQKKIALIAIILFWLFHIKRNRIGALLLLFLTPLLYFKTGFLQKINTLLKKTLELNLLGEDKVRLRLLDASWQNFIENPFFGKGAVEHTLFFSLTIIFCLYCALGAFLHFLYFYFHTLFFYLKHIRNAPYIFIFYCLH